MSDPIQFKAGNPNAYLDIAVVNVSFGCGGNNYLGRYNSTASESGQSKVVFTDDAQPCYEPLSDTPTNISNLDDLTHQFGADFLKWLGIQFDYQFAGICNIQPNAYIDEIELDYTSTMASTRIRSMPWNGWPNKLGHTDPDCPAGPPGVIGFGVTAGVITAASGSGEFRTFGAGPFTVYWSVAPSTGQKRQNITVQSVFSSKVLSGKWFIIFKIGCDWFLGPGDC